MFTLSRCARARAAAGRVSGWPAALAASLLIHIGLALLSPPLGLARQVSPERQLRVDWRRSPAPVEAPTAAPRSPSPPVDPPPAPTPAATTPATTAPAIIAPASAVPASAAAVALTETPTAVVADRRSVTPDAAPLVDLGAFCHQRPAPIYPVLARRRGEQGRVLVTVEIDAQGVVARAEVAGSSGSRWLDSAALAAVRGWRCTPAQQAGRAVVASAMQTFSFVLHDRQR